MQRWFLAVFIVVVGLVSLVTLVLFVTNKVEPVMALSVSLLVVLAVCEVERRLANLPVVEQKPEDNELTRRWRPNRKVKS